MVCAVTIFVTITITIHSNNNWFVAITKFISISAQLFFSANAINIWNYCNDNETNAKVLTYLVPNLLICFNYILLLLIVVLLLVVALSYLSTYIYPICSSNLLLSFVLFLFPLDKFYFALFLFLLLIPMYTYQ